MEDQRDEIEISPQIAPDMDSDDIDLLVLPTSNANMVNNEDFLVLPTDNAVFSHFFSSELNDGPLDVPLDDPLDFLNNNINENLIEDYANFLKNKLM